LESESRGGVSLVCSQRDEIEIGRGKERGRNISVGSGMLRKHPESGKEKLEGKA